MDCPDGDSICGFKTSILENILENIFKTILIEITFR